MGFGGGDLRSEAIEHRDGAIAAGGAGLIYVLIHFAAPFIIKSHALMFDLLVELVVVVVLVFTVVGFVRRKTLKPVLFSLWFGLTLSVGALYVVTVPTVLDRSLSIYILSRIPPDQAVDIDELTQVVEADYFEDYDVVPIRFVEQGVSGSLVQQDGTVRITDRGKRIVATTQAYRALLASKYGDEVR